MLRAPYTYIRRECLKAGDTSTCCYQSGIGTVGLEREDNVHLIDVARKGVVKTDLFM